MVRPVVVEKVGQLYRGVLDSRQKEQFQYREKEEVFPQLKMMLRMLKTGGIQTIEDLR